MSGIKKLKIRILALLWMVVGSSMVLLFIFYLNSLKKDIVKNEEKKVVSISTQPKKKPPKKVKKIPEKKIKKVSKDIKRLAPPPSLGSSISGIEISTPEFAIETDLLDTTYSNLIGNVKEDIVMTSESVDEPPIPIKRVAPEYPKKARAKGITGFVTLSLLINESGDVVKAQIVESDPPDIFEQVALNTIKQWHFEPAKYKGKPVKVWVKQTIKFKLQ